MPRTRPRPEAGRSGSTPRAGARPLPQPPVTLTELWGTRPGRLGVFVVIAATLLGMLITMASGTSPGLILGIFLVVATITAALAVRPGAVYVIFPVPAPAYAVAAVLAGLVHDHAADTSRTAFALGGAQWIAAGFIPMTVATACAVFIGGYRWLRDVG